MKSYLKGQDQEGANYTGLQRSYIFTPIMTKVYEPDIPDDSVLPSYEDVVREDANRVRQDTHGPPPTPRRDRLEQRPPAPNPRPSHSHPRPRPSSKPSSQSMHSPASLPPSPQRPPLPWTYPRGFICPKCNNTGYKRKNGRSCKSCWRRFAPVNNVNSVPSSGGSMFLDPFFPMPSGPRYGYGMPPPPQMSGSNPPLIVRPGDPRLGGVLCGECRGSGRVSFLLDEDLCPLCRGVGRILT